jgi:hypothetical protein
MGWPMDPLMWLAAKLLLSGDVEENPGPRVWTCIICDKQITNRQTSFRCNYEDHWVHQKCTNTNTRQYTNSWVCSIHSAQTSPDRQKRLPSLNKTPPSGPPDPQPDIPLPNNRPNGQKKTIKNLNILQININGLNKKIDELSILATEQEIDILTIQETKLKTTSKTPNLPNYTPVRLDRAHRDGGGLLTYIRNDITFTNTKIPPNINTQSTEIQTIKIHLSNHKHIHLTNIYIPPRDCNNPITDNDITNCLIYCTSLTNSIITADINAHHRTWYSPTTDHRGSLIADILLNSNHLILNHDTPTRIPARDQQPTSPDITTATDNLHQNMTWKTIQELNSDHMPIKIELNTKTKYRLIRHRHTYTNYKKANWTEYTRQIENNLTDIAPPNDVHLANKIMTNLILSADKHYIPRGRIKDRLKLLPENVRNEIKTRNRIRTADQHDERLHRINQEIDRDIQQYKTNLWKEHLDKNWDHRQNTQILWKTIAGLSNKRPPQAYNRTITFNDKIAITNKDIAKAFNKQFINSSIHKTNRQTDRKINNLTGDPIDITIDNTMTAIQLTKNNNSTGPDNVNIKHLKHLGPKALDYMTKIFKISLNNNIIPQKWKLAKIVPVIKSNKDPGEGTSYRPISLLSPIAKTLEKIILPYITNNIPIIPHQHGFKTKHSTITALHKINKHIVEGFNNKKPPARTIVVALDMSKAFDTVNSYKLINKLLNTDIPPIILKYIANYIKSRKAYTIYNNETSKQQQFKAGVPQGGVLSPTLFNVYTSDLPYPPPNVKNVTYADDITIYASHTNYRIAQQTIQPYLKDIHDWTKTNDLKLNAGKTTTTLFTPDPAEYSTELTLNIENTRLPTVKNPKILGLTLDPKLTYNEHIKQTTKKANKSLKILKTLTATKWGKQKETLINTYNAITRPVMEYASTIWAPITAQTNLNKLQIIQNTALRIATGCTQDTNVTHLHDETKILPLDKHLRLHGSQQRQQAQHPDHPLHDLTTRPPPDRYKKQSIFQNNNNYTYNRDIEPDHANNETIKQNMKDIHTDITENYLTTRPNNKVLNRQSLEINKTEETLTRNTRRKLAQLRTNKSPLLTTYLHKIDPDTHLTPDCPLCNRHEHDTRHLFKCTELQTDLKVEDLWQNPVAVAELLDRWGGKLGWPRD